MGEQNAKTLRAMIADQFAYMVAYAPSFPTEDETSLDSEFSRLLASLEEFGERLGQDREPQIARVRDALLAAQKAYESGEEDSGDQRLGTARREFDEIGKKRSSRNSIVLGPARK